jgi:hypothetical protein
MSKIKITSYIALGVAAGLGFAWLARRRSSGLTSLSVWNRVLSETYGADKAHRLVDQIRQRYACLLVERALPENPILRRHTTGQILPGLALYQVLLEESGGDQQAALAQVERAFRAWALSKNQLLLAPLKILPIPFWMFKLAVNSLMSSFPAAGWDFNFEENSSGRIAFNGTRCHYLDTLTAYGARELTASFCKTDDVMAELLPRSVRFVRPHTLGRGDSLCDFQYIEVQNHETHNA